MRWLVGPSGCPIRKSTDRVLAYSYPSHIAVRHVLRRLQMPRHPPRALCSFFAVDLAYSCMLASRPHLAMECLSTARTPRSSSHPSTRHVPSFSIAGAFGCWELVLSSRPHLCRRLWSSASRLRFHVAAAAQVGSLVLLCRACSFETCFTLSDSSTADGMWRWSIARLAFAGPASGCCM